MDCFRAKTINCALKWITWIYWLPSTIICTTLFVLSRFTNVNIFEENQNIFNKSANLSRIGAITTVKENEVKNEEIESPTQEKNVTVNEKNDDVKELDANGVPGTSAVLFLNCSISKAANAANNSPLQNELNSIKL